VTPPPSEPDRSPRLLPQARRRGILSEETVRRAEAPDDGVENPYWLDEEPDEHPDPTLGCIRRGLCCRSSPGWFGPGEAEQAAALLGLEPDALVRNYLVVTSIEVDGERVHAFAPVKLGRDGRQLLKPGSRADRLYDMLRGPCTFLVDDAGKAGCRIYAARPVECRRYVCTNDPDDNPTHEQIARLWLEAARGDAGADEADRPQG